MSLAGRHSSHGDEYQLQIALYWTIRMLGDDTVAAVQAESIGTADDPVPPYIDDVVVHFSDGRRKYIQAKKNHPNHREWRLKDRQLEDELQKAKNQLDHDPAGRVVLYSRSPFGALQALIETLRHYPDFTSFQNSGAQTHQQSLDALSTIWSCNTEVAASLCRRIKIGPANDIAEWEALNLEMLRPSFARPNDVKALLERMLRQMQAGGRSSTVKFTRTGVLNELAGAGHPAAAYVDKAELRSLLRQASAVGRRRVREILNERIQRSEVEDVLSEIRAGSRRILIADQPGTGKSCVLLDVVDQIEASREFEFLYIQGDHFTGSESEADLSDRGLPDNVIGVVARLAVDRRVVVVLDSLDVISLFRSQNTMRLFTGIMDRLHTLDNVSLVAACRSFDLDFDPLLRGREWDRRISLSPLAFDDHVTPLLKHVGVNPDEVQDPLRTLLCVPQHLSIFCSLRSRARLDFTSPAQLYEAYFDQLVITDPALGSEVMSAFMSAADSMQISRSPAVSTARIGLSVEAIQRLISSNLLTPTNPGFVKFAHQSLVDYLSVRHAFQSDTTLQEFIKSRFALPAIRPAVREFIAQLRAADPAEFRRSVWAVINDVEIAYHIRRLVCETVAEVDPVEEDHPLIDRIVRSHVSLAERMLLRTRREGWLDVIQTRVVPNLRDRDEPAVLLKTLGHLKTWVALQPRIIASVWKTFLQSELGRDGQLSWAIRDGVIRLTAVDPRLAREIVEGLLKHPDRNEFTVGEFIHTLASSWDGADDILWEWIQRGAVAEDGRRVPLAERRDSPSEHQIDPELLTRRLEASDYLLEQAVEYLLESTTRDADPHGFLLHNTSWGINNSAGLHCVDISNCILKGIERGAVRHAATGGTLWRSILARFTGQENTAVQYLLLRALIGAPEPNPDAICRILMDPGVYVSFQLEAELCELITAGYPYISAEVMQQHQQLLLSEIDGLDPRDVYLYLSAIPRPYRTLGTEAFVDARKPLVGPERHFWRPRADGGMIGGPVSSDDLLQLSSRAVTRLCFYYISVNQDDEEWIGGVGRRVGELPSVLRAAATQDPAKFIRVFRELVGDSAFVPYTSAIEYGVATHVSVRFGRAAKDNNWDPVEPLLSGHEICAWLLDTVERRDLGEDDEGGIRQAVSAICSTCVEEAFVQRAIVVLQRVFETDATPLESGNNMFRGINSIMGAAAESSLHLYNRLVEAGAEVPGVLSGLVGMFAKHPDPAVRVTLLSRITYTIWARPEVGWKWYADIMADAPPDFWQWAEGVLYHNYHSNFGYVEPYLDRLQAESANDAKRTYGRIATLCVLAGHRSLDSVFESLSADNVEGWRSVWDVLVTNSSDPAHRDLCERGILAILEHEAVPLAVAEHLSLRRATKSAGLHLSPEIVRAWLRTEKDLRHRWRAHDATEWILDTVKTDPLTALPVVEDLADYYERADGASYVPDQTSLAQALNALLREADERDDPDLITRVIRLQDRFLLLGIAAVESMLDAAAGP